MNLMNPMNPNHAGCRVPAVGAVGWYHSDTMANVLIRDLADEVLEQLKAAAKAHGRSLQAEIHDVLERASMRNIARTRRLSAQWLKRLRKSSHVDSTASIRQDRDRR